MRDVYERLGLSAEADVREIRKAYARELKKIDQENDPQGFQSLRTAYELALQLANGETPVLDASDSDHGYDHDQRLIDKAWQQCLEAIAQAPQVNAQVWEARLREALAGEQLINLNNALFFEAVVAQALVYSRQPEHESLFIAAARVFDWEHSSRRLASLQRAGTVLDHALVQRRLLDGLPQQQQAALRAAIERMHDPRRIELEDLDSHCLALNDLQHSFPALMAVTIGNVTFHRWLNAGSDESLYTPATDEEEQWDELARSKKRVEYRFWRLVLIFMFLAPVLIFCGIAVSTIYYPIK